jgi:hypothetical protein
MVIAKPIQCNFRAVLALEGLSASIPKFFVKRTKHFRGTYFRWQDVGGVHYALLDRRFAVSVIANNQRQLLNELQSSYHSDWKFAPKGFCVELQVVLQAGFEVATQGSGRNDPRPAEILVFPEQALIDTPHLPVIKDFRQANRSSLLTGAIRQSSSHQSNFSLSRNWNLGETCALSQKPHSISVRQVRWLGYSFRQPIDMETGDSTIASWDTLLRRGKVLPEFVANLGERNRWVVTDSLLTGGFSH